MKKFNKTLLFAVLGIFFFFASTNAYAQINFREIYESTISAVNIAQGAQEDEYNSARSQAVNTVTALSNAIIYIAPELSSSSAQLYDSDSVSPDMKKGLYGLVKDGVYSMYQSQPHVNVYAHLTEEWVPGNQQSSSLYAASGYEELTAINLQNVWSISRNITYVFFIVVMIIVGFMIMFRSKLGGQTLVTLANTLPNIVIAIIGVTFSFAIAGILIDIGGAMMLVIKDVFTQGGYEPITLESFSSIFGTLVPSSLFSGGGSDGFFFGFIRAEGGLGTFSNIIINPEINNPAPQAGVISLLLILVIMIVATVGVFMVFITLVKAYLGILIQVITGPFQIALSAIPGKGISFVNWIKSISRNILVYPLVFSILNLPGVFYALNGGEELQFPGPEKLTLGDNSGITFGITFAGRLTVFVVQIVVLFLASKADKYAFTIIPPSVSKKAGNALDEAKSVLGKIPLVGNLLTSK